MRINVALATMLCVGVTMAASQEQTTPAQEPSAPAVTTPPPAKTPGITKRQANQRARIHEGVKSGELTKGEAAKLRSEERKIRRDKRAAKADGVVTPEEKAKLTKEQNKVSKEIYRKKHNERERPKAK